jgi:hypothetical protein
LIVEALYISATQNKEGDVAEYLELELKAQTLSLKRLKQQFNQDCSPSFPLLTIEQHALSSYDQLFESSPSSHDSTESLPESQHMKQLRLSHILNHWESVEHQAVQEQWSYSKFLLILCELESLQRNDLRLRRALTEAQLPSIFVDQSQRSNLVVASCSWRGSMFTI